MVTARISFENVVISEVVNIIKDNIGLKHERNYGGTLLLTGERYSFWRDSEIMITVIIFQAESRTNIEVFSGGAKDNIWGASMSGDSKAVDKIIRLVSEYCTKNGRVPNIEKE